MGQGVKDYDGLLEWFNHSINLSVKRERYFAALRQTKTCINLVYHYILSKHCDKF